MAKRLLDTLATVVTRFGGKSVNLLVFLIVARQLSLAEMAIYGFVFSTTLIFSTMLDLGIRNSLAVFVGQEPDRAASYTRASFLVWCVLAAVGVPISYITLHLSSLSIDIAALAPPFSLLLAAMLYLRMMQGTVLGEGDIRLFNTSELISRFVLLPCTLLLLAIPGSFTLMSAMWVLALSQLVAAVYLFARQYRFIFRPSANTLALTRRLIARGFLFMLAVLLMNAAKRVSFLVVSHVEPKAAAGLFFSLQRLTEIITEVGMAIAVVAFSYSVRAKSVNDALEGSAAMSRVAMVLFTLISVAMVASSSISVPLLLGARFAVDGWLFPLLVGTTLIGAPWTILFPSLSVVLSPARVLLLMLPGVSLNILTALPLTRAYGLEGAALSMLLSNLVLTGSFLVLYKVKFGIPMNRFLVIGRSDLSGLGTLVGKITSRIKR